MSEVTYTTDDGLSRVIVTVLPSEISVWQRSSVDDPLFVRCYGERWQYNAYKLLTELIRKAQEAKK